MSGGWSIVVGDGHLLVEDGCLWLKDGHLWWGIIICGWGVVVASSVGGRSWSSVRGCCCPCVGCCETELVLVSS